MWRNWNACALWEECKMVQPLQEYSMKFSQKAKQRIVIGSSNSTPRCKSKELKAGTQTVLLITYSQQHNSQLLKGGKNPRVHRQMSE